MKKYPHIPGLLIGIFCLALLASCQPQSGSVDINYLSDPKFDAEEVLPQYDHDKGWFHRLGGKSFCATEDTLFFAGLIENHTFIHYCDLATGFSGPLCGKPECPHNGSQCNAYTQSGDAFGLSIYDGKLYWMDSDENWNPAIFCMNLDGTDRVKVCTLDRSQHQRVHGNRMLIFHRGYAVYGGKTTVVSDGTSSYGVLVYAISLATGEETVILDQMFEEGSGGEVDLVPYRNRLYLIQNRWNEETVSLNISEWSLKTHETKSIYSQEVDNIFFREVWPTENGFLLSSAGEGYGEIYQFDFATNELSLLFDLNAEGGNYGSAEFASGYLVVWELTEERIPHIHVTDLEGNVVYSEDLDLPDWPSQGIGYGLIGADHDNVYMQLTLKKAEGNSTKRLTVIAQVPLNGGGTVRELWSVERELG